MVIAARGEQAGDLGEDPRFVVDHDGEHMALGGAFRDFHGVQFLDQRLGFIVHRAVDLVAIEQHVGMRGA